MSLEAKGGGGINPRMLLVWFYAAKSGKAPTDFSEMKFFSLWFHFLPEQVCLSQRWSKFGFLSAKSVFFPLPVG